MRIALIVAFLLAPFGPLFAQDQVTITEQEPSQAPQPVLRPRLFPPYQAVEDAAGEEEVADDAPLEAWIRRQRMSEYRRKD